MKAWRWQFSIAMMLLATALIAAPRNAHAFCGFYVGKAGGDLYNHASKVVMVRDGNRTVLSLMNDYQGEPSDFALVVPVPVVLQKEQIHVGDRELFQKVDDYSAPRLVEYFDPNPCQVYERAEAPMAMSMAGGQLHVSREAAAKALGVTVEAQYTVGEYDIVILSAKESNGLETWLQQSGYKIPLGAHRALEPYIAQDMKFFVAKVNLKERERTGLSYLRPLQFAFETPKFMLPIRLGMINAQGPQDLIIFALTRDGRVETTNYRTEKIPTAQELPEYVRSDFPHFYGAMFDRQVHQNDMRAVFTEYVWNMGWCDPCAAPPLSRDELRKLGVFWLDEQRSGPNVMTYPPMVGGPVPVMLTRLHVRYSSDTFPEDPTFQTTSDQENFQARYILQHPWNGSPNACPAAQDYFRQVSQRQLKDAQTLADLTGWDLGAIVKKAGLSDSHPTPWWHGLWD